LAARRNVRTPLDIGSVRFAIPELYFDVFCAFVRCSLAARRLAYRAKVGAQIIDQSIAIRGIDDRAPLCHLVHFLGPSSLAEALLQDDARFVTFQTRRGGLRLHCTGG